ncbi:unnamed protein product [Urochloa decumbens]|uniref:Uncharacterized protein n=1 Tax=Urochloa decumbens TaxID=240449 RepID=A0ABC8XRD5_9POAL
MATEDTVFSTSDDASSIALLRCLRAGAAAIDFVHRVDVCSAAPEDLVANLEPAPGTQRHDQRLFYKSVFKCSRVSAGNGDQEFYYVDHQVQPPLLVTGHQMTMPQCLLPAEEEQQVQVQENTLVTPQQPQQNTSSLFPAQGETDWELYEQMNQFLSEDNPIFTMDELLVVPGYEDELIGSCSGTPTSTAPPDAGFT